MLVVFGDVTVVAATALIALAICCVFGIVTAVVATVGWLIAFVVCRLIVFVLVNCVCCMMFVVMIDWHKVFAMY